MKTIKITILVLLTVITLFGCSNSNTEDETQTSQAHKFEFTTGVLATSVSVGLTTIIDYEDGTQDAIESEFNRTTNFIGIDLPENVVHFKANFYIEIPTEVNIKFYGVEDNTIIHQEINVIETFEYEYSF